MMSADPIGRHEIFTSPPVDFPAIAAAASLGGTLAAGAATPAELAAAFSLHSLPGALHTVYLDFDGHLTRDTLWNTDFQNPNILTPAWSLDDNVTEFSTDELLTIEFIWASVAEDFRPFHVNVTTQDPGIEALRNTGLGDTMWGQRVVIGGDTNDWYTPIDGEEVGGVAYGSFTWDSDTPTFAFEPGAISHEVGHTLGLAHDGQFRDWVDITDPMDEEWHRVWVEYYPGHGVDATSWTPIMGAGAGNLSQWSWSEYFNATNNEEGTGPLQDDLAIITAGNGFGYRVDDHGSSIGAATPLTLDAEAKEFSGEGIIEQRTDLDYFSFTVKGLGELVTFDISPFLLAPNLDIEAKIYDSAGVVIASSNPLDDIVAGFSDLFLSPGTYYLSVDGVGRPITFIDPAIHPRYEFTDPPDPVVLDPDTSDWGYSDYGSLGYFSISGTRTPLVVGVDFDAADGTSPENWNLFSGGGPTATLTNLVNEAGVTMSYDLTITTTGTSIDVAPSLSPIDSADLPNHARPLDGLDGYIAGGTETLSFEWSGLKPSTVYQIYVFGHSDLESRNLVTVEGGVWNGVDQEFEFSQIVEPSGLVVNDDDAPGGKDLATLTYFVISDASGEITITVDNEEGYTSAIAGLAIAPTEVGSIEGQKWNDEDGDRVNDPNEDGLEGWTIYLDTNNDGILNFSSTPDQTVTQIAPNVPQPLVDNNITKNELDFSEVGIIEDVKVQVNITHPFIADMELTLVSPSGTRVELIDDKGGFGDNLFDTVFDDSAARSISSILPHESPFTGTFRPLEPLSAFDGEDANGIWTLEIRDDANGDIGVLNSWSLTLTLAGVDVFLEPVTVTDANGNYKFDNLQAGAYYVREHASQDQIVEGWRPSWLPPPVTVASDARVMDVDIGNWIPVSQHGSIHGITWNDEDGDGEKDAEEAGVPDWIVYVDANGNGQRDLATEPVVINNTDPPKPIKDFSQVQSQVTFEELGTVLDVEITLNLKHSFVGDLDAHLISPSGRTVQLFTGVGGQFNDLQDLTLADDAEQSISTMDGDDLSPSGSYTGRWRPEGLLSDFIGDDSAGIWTLVIRDNVFADQGRLESWSLAITAGESYTTTEEDGSYSFANLPAGEYVVRAVPRLGWVQVPPADTSIPAAEWENSQWVVSVEGVDDPQDPVPDSRRNVKNVNFANQSVVLLPGDYNGNGRVDAADYVVWRKTLTSTATPPYSGADGNGSGIIDNEDHVAWIANFGNALSPGSGSAVQAAASTGGEAPASAAALVVEALVSSAQADVAIAATGSGTSSLASNEASAFDVSPGQQTADSGRALHRPAARRGLFASTQTTDLALLELVSGLANGDNQPSDDWSSRRRADSHDADGLDAVDWAFDDVAELLAV